jgi:hypothetical protein
MVVIYFKEFHLYLNVRATELLLIDTYRECITVCSQRYCCETVGGSISDEVNSFLFQFT